MTTIRVRFLHGWLRAAGRGDGALMGSIGTASGEWPPSPARLFAALVAGGGSGIHRRAPGDDSELRAIEEAGAPVITADAEHDVARSALIDRFVVRDETATGNVQNYPARVSTLSRPGTRLAPRHPEVSYSWPDLHLDGQQLAALAWRAARVGYLGTSDAPAHVSVAVGPVDTAAAWIPDRAGTVSIAVPFPGSLDTLDRAFEAWLGGAALPGSTIAREVARYRPPGESAEPQRDEQILLWASFDRAYSGHRLLAVGESVKGLTLSAFGPPGSSDEAPPVLTGHGLADGAERARYWPLPHVGSHGDGRLFGVCIALPAGTPPALVQRVRARLDGGELHLAGASPRRVELYTGEPGPRSANPARWRQRSRTWVSAAPVVLIRHPGGDPSAADVARMCADAGLPAPASYEFARVPLTHGAVDLRPHQTVRKGARPRPYGHLRVCFDRPVRGPFALGQMRSLGLGLMVPDADRKERGR